MWNFYLAPYMWCEWAIGLWTYKDDSQALTTKFTDINHNESRVWQTQNKWSPIVVEFASTRNCSRELIAINKIWSKEAKKTLFLFHFCLFNFKIMKKEQNTTNQKTIESNWHEGRRHYSFPILLFSGVKGPLSSLGKYQHGNSRYHFLSGFLLDRSIMVQLKSNIRSTSRNPKVQTLADLL